MPAHRVKRLGFSGLFLEPEYIVDRLQHTCAELKLPCQVQELRISSAELMRLEITQVDEHGGACQVVLHVMPDSMEGSYCLTMTRQQGDTFQFHALYRMLRTSLSDFIVPAEAEQKGSLRS